MKGGGKLQTDLAFLVIINQGDWKVSFILTFLFSSSEA